jgi:peptide/nickel transport system permease protein
MVRFIARRLIQAVPTLFGILLLTFLVTRLSPADPVKLMVAGNFDITPEDRAVLYHSLGLDDPLPVQFARYVLNVARLDFGNSFYYHRPAIDMIAERIPNSLQLSVLSLILALVIGVPLGVVAAYRRGRPADHAIRIFSVAGHAIPEFWFGLLFVTILGVELRWFPIGSMNAIGKDGELADRAWHLVGPVLALAVGLIATYPRYLRTQVLEIVSQDYVRTAHAKGLRENAVRYGHVVRNTLIPIVTLFGGLLAIVLSGSVVIERVFNWPGLGRLLFDAVVNKDYPLVEASVVIGSVLLLVSYILRDIAYAIVDPRITVS